MFLTRRNFFVLSALSLIAIFFYTVELPYEQLSAASTVLRADVLPLLRQLKLPYQLWSPLSPVRTPTSNERQSDSQDTRTKFTRHIVAVGDLHGDMPNARRVLQFSSVTDDNGDWSGDVDFFVQTGDIIDRCVDLF